MGSICTEEARWDQNIGQRTDFQKARPVRVNRDDNVLLAEDRKPWRCRLKNELLVYGYCQHTFDQEMPDVVMDLCVTYLHLPKFDSTLGGKISWKRVADFSALLPKGVKLKLWNGVFPTERSHQAAEVTRISKIMRTFVMLQLTRKYKKSNEAVPADIKTQLVMAVKEPCIFISNFLKQKDKGATMDSIYESLKEHFVSLSASTEDERKKQQYDRKLRVIEENFVELTEDGIKEEFNKDDFLKKAFLQYMLYAYLQDIAVRCFAQNFDWRIE